MRASFRSTRRPVADAVVVRSPSGASTEPGSKPGLVAWAISAKASSCSSAIASNWLIRRLSFSSSAGSTAVGLSSMRSPSSVSSSRSPRATAAVAAARRLIFEADPKGYFERFPLHDPLLELVTDVFVAFRAVFQGPGNDTGAHRASLVDQDRMLTRYTPFADDGFRFDPESVDRLPGVTQACSLVVLLDIAPVGETKITAIAAFGQDFCTHRDPG